MNNVYIVDQNKEKEQINNYQIYYLNKNGKIPINTNSMTQKIIILFKLSNNKGLKVKIKQKLQGQCKIIIAKQIKYDYDVEQKVKDNECQSIKYIYISQIGVSIIMKSRNVQQQKQYENQEYRHLKEQY